MSSRRPAAAGALRTARGVLALLFGAGLGLLFLSYGVAVMRVGGDSMAPTLLPGQVVLSLRPALGRLLFPDRGHQGGDVVVVAVGDPPELLVKRIAATGGQTVSLRGGAVWIDGAPLEEAWARPRSAGAAAYGPEVVPAGRLFVLGDNRLPLASRDSRSFGSLAEGAVRGRLILLLRSPLDAGRNLRWPFAALR